jgi:hypothetical protein
MPNARLKDTGVLFVDPGGDPAAPHVHAGHGSASSGGFVDSSGAAISTQATGWRQLLITRGVAT